MTSDYDRSSRPRRPGLDRPLSAPVSERRVYRAEAEPATRRPRRPARRSPVLAIVVLVILAVIITVVGVAAHGGGLVGSQNSGTFKLVPLSTTTST